MVGMAITSSASLSISYCITVTNTNILGWKGNALQTALDERCAGDACKGMKTQSAADANKCMLQGQQKHIQEDVEGCKCYAQLIKPSSFVSITLTRLSGLPSLPGNVQVTYS